MSSVNLKRSYRCFPSLQQFYTGGPFVVSSDGSFLVCACDDKIKIVESSNASIRYSIEGDEEAVTALALTPDDKLLFSVSQSRQIRIWDLSSFRCLRSWKAHDGPVMAMACDSSGALLATAGADKKVFVWDVEGGYCTHFFKGHKGVVTSIKFHPNPNNLLLFSGSDDATVRVWDLVSKKCVAVLDKHFSTVTSLAVSENGWTLLSAGRDKVVNLWDLRNYSFKMTVPTYEVLEAVCVIQTGTSFASYIGSYLFGKGKKKSDGSSPIYFLTVGERGIVRAWSSDGASCIYEQKYSDASVSSDKDDERRGFTSAVMLPFNQGLLCVTADQQFLYYLPTQCDGGEFCLSLSKRLVGYNEEIVDMKFLGEDEQFLALATNLEQVRVYDLASMSCMYVLAGHADTVLCLDTCVSTSGRTLVVTGSKDNTVRLWEHESQSCIGVGAGHMGAVGAVAFSKKQRKFFVSGSCDRTLKVWNLDDFIVDVNETVDLKARAVVSAHDKDINSLSISPDDTLLCSGSQDHTACIWKLPSLVSVVTLRGHKRGIWSVEFSPVDKCVITSSGDRTVKIWEVPSGACLKTFEGHTSSVLRASFLTRGTQIISCGADGLLKLWTVKSSECLATYDRHEDKVWALAVGKKTEMLATGGSDAVVNLWHDSTAADKEEAFLKEEEGVLKGQELENAVLDAEYTKAIQLAFELRRPHKLFELMAELCMKKDAEEHLRKTLGALGMEEIRLLLEYVREWNTKPKLCHVAQFVLFHVFNIFPPTELIEIHGISELLEGLVPYSYRHFSRIDRLLRSTFLLDYTLTGMSVIEPESDYQPDLRCVNEQQSAELNGGEMRQSSLEIVEKVFPKKRKPSKSRKGIEKKSKEARLDASVISLQA
ncbi:protein TORMOZ EMBRYO DEFECTIVE [Aristolochia californica]|uniref:protein TORMOZ EMBRYO DEFECTIVE n=1 Tax=Aristolochia californica TaxID=171875 RepID=UPI0035DB3270